jgi:hypothetical protein
MTAQIEEFVLTGHANVILETLDLTVHYLNAQEDAAIMDIVQMVFATVDWDGEEIHVKLQFVQIIVIIMENVLMENAIVDQGLQEMIVRFVHAHPIVMAMENV